MSQNIKLPKNAIPNRYEIDLDIDLENFKYAGKETIYIEVVDDSTEIQLNSLAKKAKFHIRNLKVNKGPVNIIDSTTFEVLECEQ